ncbi:MAG: sulfatase-like hydrolase/transferase [Crocinitomicaceae bacterium]
MKSFLSLTLMALSILLSACKKDEIIECEVADVISEPKNILFIIADDLGKDAINGFSEGTIKPNTPNIDAIRNAGVTFSNLWVYPTCTPTRSSIITGKYGYSTDVKWAGDQIDEQETVLQKYISDHTSNKYASAIVGKWHLSGNNSTANPETFGIDYYAGLIRGAVDDYYQWQLTEDGVTSVQTKYTTELFTDLAINWVNEQSKPWFLWLAYNAPHTPFHAPPSDMQSQGSLPDYTSGMDPIPYYMAAIEAMDFQIGRLIENIPADEMANTVIIFIGDNGTPNQVAQSPYSSSTVKGTLFQGGVNAPMFISGKGVSRIGVDENLVTSTDLFATIAEIAGVVVSEIHDSKSFKSQLTSEGATSRAFQYVEMDDGNSDQWAIRNASHKLIVKSNGTETFYDLLNDPYEQDDLLSGTLSSAETAQKSKLEAELLLIRQ